MSTSPGKVTGIGGIFFKARNLAKMVEWYRDQLGIVSEDGHVDFLWRSKDRPDETGRTVWAMFPEKTDYFGPSGQSFMINYRVENLNDLLDRFHRNGVAVEKVEEFDYGKFAWITDPEGNRIELWEPKEK